MSDHAELKNFIWQIADLLRGPYRPPQYERVMLPMTVLRRFDCVLEETKPKVLAAYDELYAEYGVEIPEHKLDTLRKKSGQQFYNTSPLGFQQFRGSPDSLAQDIVSYINGFSDNVRKIFRFFDFEKEIEKMREENILYLVVSEFARADLHPTTVPNHEMGALFENLIRRFNEMANEVAGDYFTPREIVKLMIDLLFVENSNIILDNGVIKEMLDPCCGTGGMLAEAQSYLREYKPGATLFTYGQDYNQRAYAIAASDMLMKDVDHNGQTNSIRYGDSLVDDQFAGKTFDYLISNPPFGVDWKKQRSRIKAKHEQLGFDGPFGAGLPRVNDGALLFLQHMVAKFEPVDAQKKQVGSRMAIVFSGSPLFAGGAGSGESEIRRWLLENDLIETIIALPEQMYYNTGIGTYIWLLTNNKTAERRGKVQLVDGREHYIPMSRSLGSKRRKLGEGEDGEPDNVEEIVRLYGRFQENKESKIFPTTEFGVTRVTVERPLRLRYQMTQERKSGYLNSFPHLLDDIQAIDKELGREPLTDWNKVNKRIKAIIKKNNSRWKVNEKKAFVDLFTDTDPAAEPVRKNKTTFEADPKLRDYENVPLGEDVDAYFAREVRPHRPLAWMNRDKDKVGYEINFNRYFYTFTPPRPLEVIDRELEAVEEEILGLLKGVTG